ncbi:hypothetical protein [Moheibacter stercoris]|uniref:Uncharacterized protein n=1 Tax=Moheibacter stercoris TaxID=1628251 RepID=A0ABV2LUN0_9FLAO
MKKRISFLSILWSIFTFAQIGIGVENPTELLEVDGTTVINDKFYVDGLDDYSGTVDDFHLIAINPESDDFDGSIIEFYGNQEIMPIIIQPYEIQNIYRDDLNNLDLNVSTDQYVISISNFEAIPSANNLGLYKISGNNSSTSSRSYGNFVIRAFAQSGTWRVNIGSPTANTRNTTDRYTYKFDVVLFPKRFFKNIGNINYNLNGSNSGQAPVAPNL